MPNPKDWWDKNIILSFSILLQSTLPSLTHLLPPHPSAFSLTKTKIASTHGNEDTFPLDLGEIVWGDGFDIKG